MAGEVLERGNPSPSCVEPHDAAHSARVPPTDWSNLNDRLISTERSSRSTVCFRRVGSFAAAMERFRNDLDSSIRLGSCDCFGSNCFVSNDRFGGTDESRGVCATLFGMFACASDAARCFTVRVRAEYLLLRTSPNVCRLCGGFDISHYVKRR